MRGRELLTEQRLSHGVVTTNAPFPIDLSDGAAGGSDRRGYHGNDVNGQCRSQRGEADRRQTGP